jgi:hypothetical protein
MPTNAPVRVSLEPEIQYKAPVKLLSRIESLLTMSGGVQTSQRMGERTYYWDTRNFKLFREGMECRGRQKGSGYRFDLKVAADTSQATAFPDENGVLWRYELKAPSTNPNPDLSVFFDQVAIPELRERLRDVYPKQVEPKFVGVYDKKKIERTVGAGNDQGLIEYSLQRGYIETLDGKHRTRTMGIVDVELREGANAAHIEAKEELESIYGDKGLVMLPRRKLIMGMELIEPKQIGKAFDRLHEALDDYRSYQREMVAAMA